MSRSIRLYKIWHWSLAGGYIVSGAALGYGIGQLIAGHHAFGLILLALGAVLFAWSKAMQRFLSVMLDREIARLRRT